MWIIQIVLVPAVSPLCVGVIRKLKALFQNRHGASIFQPYRDIWKLLHKDEVITRDASWITYYAPYIIFGVTMLVGLSVPLFTSLLASPYIGDMLMVIYTLAIGTFFLALAGIDSGGGFGGFGASREMTVAALAEGGFVFSLLTVALISGNSNLFVIANSGVVSGQFLFPVLLASLGFFIVLLAETARFPFDNPATHLELTMIHEAMILEYSGKRLALIEWAAANKLLILAAIGVNVFFPWGIAQTTDPASLVLGVGALLVKVLVLCFVIAFIESTMSKYRFFRLPDLLMIAFVLNIVAIALLN